MYRDLGLAPSFVAVLARALASVRARGQSLKGIPSIVRTGI